MSIKVPTLGATAAALAAGALLLPGASAQDPGPRTITLRELEKGATFSHIRNKRAKTARSIAQGDLIVFTNPLADTSGARVGVVHVSCVATVGARDFTKSTMLCGAVARLRDGDLTSQILVRLGRARNTGAITGGTGAYAGARGVITSVDGENGATDTITLS